MCYKYTSCLYTTEYISQLFNGATGALNGNQLCSIQFGRDLLQGSMRRSKDDCPRYVFTESHWGLICISPVLSSFARSPIWLILVHFQGDHRPAQRQMVMAVWQNCTLSHRKCRACQVWPHTHTQHPHICNFSQNHQRATGLGMGWNIKVPLPTNLDVASVAPVWKRSGGHLPAGLVHRQPRAAEEGD